jgi:hypothetical protein
MSYASMSIDRRADYYARCAGLIAEDPLDFYTRAEKGRRYLARQFQVQHAPMVSDLFEHCALWTERKVEAPPVRIEGRPGFFTRILAA